MLEFVSIETVFGLLPSMHCSCLPTITLKSLFCDLRKKRVQYVRTVKSDWMRVKWITYRCHWWMRMEMISPMRSCLDDDIGLSRQSTRSLPPFRCMMNNWSLSGLTLTPVISLIAMAPFRGLNFLLSILYMYFSVMTIARSAHLLCLFTYGIHQFYTLESSVSR